MSEDVDRHVDEFVALVVPRTRAWGNFQVNIKFTSFFLNPNI